MNECPHCGEDVFRQSGGKLKVGRTPVVLHKGGSIEINCPGCRRGVILGQLAKVELRKATPPLIVMERPPGKSGLTSR